jgi:hypothetical protein
MHKLINETRGQTDSDTQHLLAANEAAGGQTFRETHRRAAAGSTIPTTPDQPDDETQCGDVRGAAAGLSRIDPHAPCASGGNLSDTVEEITRLHRRRRFAMKIQQKLDRALESFVRREYTDWSPDLSESERKKRNDETKRLIAAAKKGQGDTALLEIVAVNTKAREPADDLRKGHERAMAGLARSLPVWPWVEGIRGAAEGGLATIVAETGDLSNYPSPAHVWSRLGYAPFDGHAGSTWKRDTWRKRTLSKEEWVAHPFAGERYAFIYSLSDSMFRAQWISAKKAGEDEGKPNGPYGNVYADRRATTMVTHPEWTKMHRRQDALRVMMKAFLKDLWVAWNGK